MPLVQIPNDFANCYLNGKEVSGSFFASKSGCLSGCWGYTTGWYSKITQYIKDGTNTISCYKKST